MKKTAILATLLLVFAAWAVAQSSTSQSTPAGMSGQSAQSPSSSQAPSASQTPSTPSTPSTSQAPSSSMPSGSASDQASSPSSAAGGGDMVEGCLGGAAPDFTVTDKAGTTYKLIVPQGADTAVLTKHVGESVQAVGTIGGGSSAASTTGTPTSSASSTTSGASSTSSASTGGDHTIAVTKIGRGTGSCPASGSKPPSK